MTGLLLAVALSVGTPIAPATAGMTAVGAAFTTPGCGLELTARFYERGATITATTFRTTARLALVYLYGASGVATAIYAADPAGLIQYRWFTRTADEINAVAICHLVQRDALP